MRVEDEPAYVLETRPYRETSLLVEAFTARHGRVALVARGVRGAGRAQGARRAALSPFGAVRIGFSGRGEVLTLSAIEAEAAPLRPTGPALFAALYVNELVQKLTGRGDPAPRLFRRYAVWLGELADIGAASAATSPDVGADVAPEANLALSWALRRFERDLLALLGYALALDHDSDAGEPIEPEADYALDPEHGARPWQSGSPWPRVRGDVLLAWAGDAMPTPECSRQLRTLARAVIRHHLGGAELRAWKLAAQWRR
jgi:DNA repair protein RecO (recombination protein O)